MSSTEQIRAALGKSRRWVVKVGTALTTNEGVGLNLPAIRDWVEQIAELQSDGREIVVVTSCSVAEGAARLGWKKRPHVLNQLQAAAAIGLTSSSRTTRIWASSARVMAEAKARLGCTMGWGGPGPRRLGPKLIRRRARWGTSPNKTGVWCPPPPRRPVAAVGRHLPAQPAPAPSAPPPSTRGGRSRRVRRWKLSTRTPSASLVE